MSLDNIKLYITALLLVVPSTMLMADAAADHSVTYRAQLSKDADRSVLALPAEEPLAFINFDADDSAVLRLFVSTSVPDGISGFYYYDPADESHSIVLNKQAYDLSTVIHESVHAAYFYLRYNKHLCKDATDSPTPCFDNMLRQEQLAYVTQNLVSGIIAHMYPYEHRSAY